MIAFKPGVWLNGVTTNCLRGLSAAAEVFEREGYDLVVTSARDGRHLPLSKHYTGEAFDCRSKHLPTAATKERILNTLRAVLGPDWDVILEYPGELNEHFHCEYDPT